MLSIKGILLYIENFTHYDTYPGIGMIPRLGYTTYKAGIIIWSGDALLMLMPPLDK